MRVKELIIILFTMTPMLYMNLIRESPNVYVNEIGNLRLTNQYWRIRFDLDTHEYFATADLLEDNINKLKLICKEMKSPICEFFIVETEKFASQIDSDISLFQAFKRTKRFIPFVVLGGITIMALIGTIAANRAALHAVANELNGSVETMKNTLNTTQESFEIQQAMLKEVEEKFDKLGDKLNEYIISTDNFKRQTSILLVMLYLMRKHDIMNNKFKDYFLGNKQEKIFSIIDFNQFTDVIDEINRNLTKEGKNFSLLKMDSPNVTDLIRISHDSDGILFSIVLDVPILTKDKYVLYEFIPIPEKDESSEDSIYIFDINSFLYLSRGKEYFITDEKNLTEKCEYIHELTVCDASYESTLHPPSGCMEALLLNESIGNCIRRPIEYQNHLIRITDKILFAYIVQPMKIKLICDGVIRVLDILETRKIEFTKSCKQYTDLNLEYLNVTTFTNIHINNSFVYPEIEIYNSTNRLWSNNISIIERNKIKLIKIRDSFKSEYEEFDKRSLNIENLKTNFTSNITDFFNIDLSFIPKFFENQIVRIAAILLGSLIIIKICFSLIKRLIGSK